MNFSNKPAAPAHVGAFEKPFFNTDSPRLGL